MLTIRLRIYSYLDLSYGYAEIWVMLTIRFETCSHLDLTYADAGIWNIIWDNLVFKFSNDNLSWIPARIYILLSLSKTKMREQDNCYEVQ